MLNVETKKKCKVRLEYIVYFSKAGGKTSKKIFQLIEKVYGPGSFELTRHHSFADLSTRKHHPGEHRISIVVNGVEKADAKIMLRAS